MKKIFLLLFGIWCFYQSAMAWKELTPKEISRIYGTLAYKKGNPCGVRRVFKQTPEGSAGNQPIVFIVVHGTFASDSTEYFDEFLTRVQVCAQQFAWEHTSPVEIILVRWSGDNTAPARRQGGNCIAKIIDMQESKKVITIAHSHGCTVVNYASNRIKNDIDIMAHYAAPIISEDDNYKPNNFKLLCNFYSLTDIIQLFGALGITKTLKESLKYFSIPDLSASREYNPQIVGDNAGRIINIRTRFHGYETDHSAIKNAVSVLPYVLDDISKIYHHNNALELNVDVMHRQHPILLWARNEKTNKILEENIHSEKQKELYRQMYGKEVEALQPRLAYISDVMANTLLLIPSIRSLCKGLGFHKYIPQISHIKF